MKTFKSPTVNEVRCNCTHSWRWDDKLYLEGKIYINMLSTQCPKCLYTYWTISETDENL